MTDRRGDVVKPERRFGVSTHLFHEHRLTRDHLVHVAAHGFEALELFATRSHFDYHDEAARAQLAEWLSDTRLELHSVHAPAFEALRQGKWVGAFSNASADESRRRAAIAEAEAALALARLVPFQFLVTHIGVPSTEAAGGDNQRDAARRSVEDLAALASNVNVRVAIDVLSPTASLRPGIISIPLDVQTDEEIMLLVNLIMLTPGTLALDVSSDRRELFLHVMSADDPDAVRAQIKNGFERRVLGVMR